MNAIQSEFPRNVKIDSSKNYILKMECRGTIKWFKEKSRRVDETPTSDEISKSAVKSKNYGRLHNGKWKFHAEYFDSLETVNFYYQHLHYTENSNCTTLDSPELIATIFTHTLNIAN